MTKVVCLAGDGIGPEVTAAMKRVIAAAGVAVDWVDMPCGLGAIDTHGSSLPQITLDALAEHKLGIKGPTTTPLGGGHKSANVALRQHFDLHIGFRPFKTAPIPGLHPQDRMDVQIFRQNTEGLYRCTEELVIGPDGKKMVKLTAWFTETAMTRLATAAFEHARAEGRKRVTLVTKSNIHKLWGQLYGDAFRAVAAQYSGIESAVAVIGDKASEAIVSEEMLVDNCAKTLAMDPGKLDVIVIENMFGDILSDQCAGQIGGLGVAAGANIGDDCAIFEAVHGSAPDIAGLGVSNPTGLILSAVLMFRHIGDHHTADRIEKAVMDVIGCGKFPTGDILKYYRGGTRPVNNEAFTSAVCARLAAQP
jgi:isocitrate dehydrogenase (NAD+)